MAGTNDALAKVEKPPLPVLDKLRISLIENPAKAIG